MEDVITDAPPPSRFFEDDLNNFAPASPCTPSPFLLFSEPHTNQTLHPSLLIVALSQPSLFLFHSLPTKTLIGSLILPEIPFSGNSTNPSLKDKSCDIYSLSDHPGNTVLLLSFQYPLPPERSHIVSKLLFGQIIPERVLILDSVKIQNFRGKLDRDESVAYKLETSLEKKSSSLLLKGLDYLPSGSVVDGLGAALLSQCQIRNIKGALCVSWPDVGNSVVSLVRSLLLAKTILPGFEFGSADSAEDERLRSVWTKNSLLESELYT